MDKQTLTPEQLAAYIDHTLLKADAIAKDIDGRRAGRGTLRPKPDARRFAFPVRGVMQRRKFRLPAP